VGGLSSLNHSPTWLHRQSDARRIGIHVSRRGLAGRQARGRKSSLLSAAWRKLCRRANSSGRKRIMGDALHRGHRGDGIGRVISEAVQVAEAAAKKHDAAELRGTTCRGPPILKQHGRILPRTAGRFWRSTTDPLRRHRRPDVPDQVTIHELLLPMRRRFDQYVNLAAISRRRPAAAWQAKRRRSIAGDIPILIEAPPHRQESSSWIVTGPAHPGCPMRRRGSRVLARISPAVRGRMRPCCL